MFLNSAFAETEVATTKPSKRPGTALNVRMKLLKEVLRPSSKIKNSSSQTPIFEKPAKKLIGTKLIKVGEERLKRKEFVESLGKLSIKAKGQAKTNVKKVTTPLPNTSKFSISQVNSSTKLHPIQLKKQGNKPIIKLKKVINEVISEESAAWQTLQNSALKKQKNKERFKPSSENTVKKLESTLKNIGKGACSASTNVSKQMSGTTSGKTDEVALRIQKKLMLKKTVKK